MRCDHCKELILHSHKKQDGIVYCNETCMAIGVAERSVPAQVVRDRCRAIRSSACPKCSGPGPVDVQYSYEVWSIVVITRWKTVALLACRGCGRKAQAFAAVVSLLIGWWGIPWGIIMTPVQVIKNCVGFLSRTPTKPSEDLQRMVRRQILAEAEPQTELPN